VTLLTCLLLLSMLLLQFLLSDIFPEVINHKIVKPVFAVVVLLLFVAPQVRACTRLQLVGRALAAWGRHATTQKAMPLSLSYCLVSVNILNCRPLDASSCWRLSTCAMHFTAGPGPQLLLESVLELLVAAHVCHLPLPGPHLVSSNALHAARPGAHILAVVFTWTVAGGFHISFVTASSRLPPAGNHSTHRGGVSTKGSWLCLSH